MPHRSPEKANSFTLIELLIVVAIIGVLAAIAVPNFLNAQWKARLAQIEANMKNMGTAMMAYHVDHGNYPLHDPYHVRGTPGLTTPVAYMVSVPIDIFQTRGGGLNQFIRYLTSDSKRPELHQEPFYSIAGSYGVLKDDQPIPGPDQAGSLIGWLVSDPVRYGKARAQYPDGRMIFSVGPNQENNIGVLYNVSNGIRSDGEIMYIVP